MKFYNAIVTSFYLLIINVSGLKNIKNHRAQEGPEDGRTVKTMLSALEHTTGCSYQTRVYSARDIAM